MDVPVRAAATRVGQVTLVVVVRSLVGLDLSDVATDDANT
jgi:hypothetical protein